MQNHCFNILTFNHPQEELTLYFTNVEDENLTRIFNKLVPDEVIEKFGEQEHYYTSFTKEIEGFYPVTKAVNPSYETKKDENGKERSYRIHNSGLSVSLLKRYYNAQIHEYFNLWLNRYLNTIDVWDISALEKRFELISLRYLKIWPYPEVSVNSVDNAFEEQTIFDAESPRHKKLQYFIIEETKIEEEAVARMYLYVIRYMFEKNPQLLVSHQDVFKIMRNSTEFRNPQEIANGWFVEMNIDSDTKFSYLKKLLTLFGMEDDLLIQYASDSSTVKETSRFAVRRAFWKKLLPQIKNTDLFSKISPTKDHWLTAGAGISGLSFTFVVTKSYARIELAINTSNKELNKRYFSWLQKRQGEIEQMFGEELIWEELPDNKMSRIKTELSGVNIFDEGDWDRMISFLTSKLPNFEAAFRSHIDELKRIR